jgi:hypothetical protein
MSSERVKELIVNSVQEKMIRTLNNAGEISADSKFFYEELEFVLNGLIEGTIYHMPNEIVSS